jgi:WD40 repeat protein
MPPKSQLTSPSSVQSLSSAASSPDRSLDEEQRMQKAAKRFSKLQEQVKEEEIRKQNNEKRFQKIMKDVRANIERKNPQKHKKVTIKDKDCADMEDTIMKDIIPKEYAIHLDQQCYDARTLWTWMQKHDTIPHSRNKLTQEQRARIQSKHAAWLAKQAKSPATPKSSSSSSIDSQSRFSSSRASTFPDLSRTPSSVASSSADSRSTENDLGFLRNDDIEESISISENTMAMAMHPNGLKFVSAPMQGTGFVERGSPFNVIGIPSLRVEGVVEAMAYNKDGRKLAIWIRVPIRDEVDYYFQVYDTSTWAQLQHIMLDDTYPVSCAAWSPDGSVIAAGTKTSGRLLLYSATRGRGLVKAITWEPRKDIHCVAWSPDGRHLLAGIQGIRAALVWKTDTWRKTEYPTRQDVTSVCWKPQGNYFICGSGRRVYLFDVRNQIVTTHEVSEYDYDISCLAWNPTRPQIAVLFYRDRDRLPTVYVTDISRGLNGMVVKMMTLGTQPNLTADYVQWSPDGNHLIYLVNSDTERERSYMYKWRVNDVTNIRGGATHTYNGRPYAVRTGVKGGKYILVGREKKKVYV